MCACDLYVYACACVKDRELDRDLKHVFLTMVCGQRSLKAIDFKRALEARNKSIHIQQAKCFQNVLSGP